MGRVKDLWIHEKEKRFQGRIDYLIHEQGFTEAQARDIAANEEAEREEREDASNE